ncbi:MAG: metalloenzyme [Anaerolineales bacterium]
MRILFLFLDGVGLGEDDPAINPLVEGLPSVRALLEGRALTQANAPFHGARASLLALDATLGVPGLPQSATGQAALLTGRNIPREIGEHYGPKPNPQVAAHLQDGGIFGTLKRAGRRIALLNAYPAAYFEAIARKRRIYSAIPLAVTQAGLPLFTEDDLLAGNALSADFTGEGWRTQLNRPHIRLLPPEQAGRSLARLATDYDFAFFEYWLSDYAGHAADAEAARALLVTLNAVFTGLLEEWDGGSGLLLLTSDHGNLEDMRTRRHTANPVPALVIGDPALRAEFCRDLGAISDVAPAIVRFFSTP